MTTTHPTYTPSTLNRAREVALDVAYVASLAITANTGRLTTPNAGGRPVGDGGTIEVTLTVPVFGTLAQHAEELAAITAELALDGAIPVDRYAPDPNRATTLRYRVAADSASVWAELAMRPTPTFARETPIGIVHASSVLADTEPAPGDEEYDRAFAEAVRMIRTNGRTVAVLFEHAGGWVALDVENELGPAFVAERLTNELGLEPAEADHEARWLLGAN